MCACYVLRDLRKRLIPATIKLVTFIQDQHVVHFTAPASHEPRSRLQIGRTTRMLALPFANLLDEAFNVAAR